jgi:hypothetical protein
VKKSKSQKRNRLGTLGEHESKRLVKAFYEETRLRNRVAVLCGVTLGAVLVWSQLALFWAMAR